MELRLNRLVRSSRPLASLLLPAVLCAPVLAQKAPDKPIPSAVLAGDAGDSDVATTEMAKLSPALRHSNVQKAMRVVADWQVHHAEGKWNQDWTYAPLYLGLLAASETTHDSQYHDTVLKEAQQFDWKLWALRNLHADDEAIAQAYEALYAEHKDPVRIADARATFDRLVAYQDNSQKDLWWWCDALFMAPAGLARMSALTGDHKYIDAMNREWALTQQHLYDPTEKLFFRDASYFNKREANGQKIFWGRGNGWVLAGTVNVLKALPKNDPSRGRYLDLYKQMAERIAGLQQQDGLWHTGLLDQSAYPLPEISGSAFFTYGLAWGVNEGILDRAKYQPVVEKAWAGMLKHVYADGRLGCIQPIGAAPGAFQEGSSYVYGVGGFLLAGAEVDRMVHKR